MSSSALKPATEANRRDDGPKHSDPEPRTYPRGVQSKGGDKERIARKCRLESATWDEAPNALNLPFVSLVFRAIDSDLPFPTRDPPKPTITVKDVIFDHILPPVGQIGYTLIFKRKWGSEDTKPYRYIKMKKPPKENGEPTGVRPRTQASSDI